MNKTLKNINLLTYILFLILFISCSHSRVSNETVQKSTDKILLDSPIKSSAKIVNEKYAQTARRLAELAIVTSSKPGLILYNDLDEEFGRNFQNVEAVVSAAGYTFTIYVANVNEISKASEHDPKTDGLTIYIRPDGTEDKAHITVITDPSLKGLPEMVAGPTSTDSPLNWWYADYINMGLHKKSATGLPEHLVNLKDSTSFATSLYGEALAVLTSFYEDEKIPGTPFMNQLYDKTGKLASRK